jgi:hypothetical protein
MIAGDPLPYISMVGQRAFLSIAFRRTGNRSLFAHEINVEPIPSDTGVILTKAAQIAQVP